MVASWRRTLAMGVIGFLPATRLFEFKARLLRVGAVDASADVRWVSSSKVIGPQLSLGRRTFVGHAVRFYGSRAGRIDVGADVDIGPNVLFLAGSHELGPASRRAGSGRATTIQVGDGVWIGAGAIIVGPVDISRGAVVAAGETVRADVPADCLQINGKIKSLGTA